MKRQKIVYLQHASSLGGSCVSLLYTVQAIDRRRYEPHVVLTEAAPDVERLYRDAGIATTVWPGIVSWHHCSGVDRSLLSPGAWNSMAQVAQGWSRAEERTLAMVEHLQPDLVHLNSSVLLPSARALARAALPCVWHVREHPARSSWRTSIFRQMMLNTPHSLVFISEADRQAWVGGRCGEVIPNFVDMGHYHRSHNGRAVRQRLGLPDDAQVVLYMGGLSAIKGILVLLRALSQARENLPRLVCIAPNTRPAVPRSLSLQLARSVLPLVGWGTTVQRAEQLIERHQLDRAFLRMPFSHHVPELLAAADLLVFPATVPHFARPVVEAAAMGRPAIMSDLPGAKELIVHGETGLLAAPGDAAALAACLTELLSNRPRLRGMGERAHERALSLYSARHGGAKIMDIYARRLGRTPVLPILGDRGDIVGIEPAAEPAQGIGIEADPA